MLAALRVANPYGQGELAQDGGEVDRCLVGVLWRPLGGKLSICRACGE